MSSESGKKGVLPKWLGSAGIAATMLVAEAGMASANSNKAKPDNAPVAGATDSSAQQGEVKSLITEIGAHLNYGVEEASAAEREEIAKHIQAMGNDSFRVREKASKALLDIGYKARPQLMEALKNTDLEIVVRSRRILDSFARIDDERAKRLEKSVVRLGAIGPAAKDAVPVLLKVLEEPNAGIREAATETLGNIGPDASPAVPLLLKQWKHLDTEAWDKTAVALGKIGPAARDAAPVLLKRLRNPATGEVDTTVIEALGGIRAEEAVDDLIGVLDNAGSTYIKMVTARALGHIGKHPEKTLAALDRCCQDSAWLSREAGFKAALQFKSEPKLVMPILIRALGEGSVDMTRASIKTLADMGKVAKEAVPALQQIRDAQPDDPRIANWGERVAEEIRRSAGKAIEAIEASHGIAP